MANSHMRRCSMSLTAIEATTSLYLYQDSLNKVIATSNTGEHSEKTGLTYISDGEVRWFSHPGK
jgi:hypothetical protein